MQTFLLSMFTSCKFWLFNIYIFYTLRKFNTYILTVFLFYYLCSFDGLQVPGRSCDPQIIRGTEDIILMSSAHCRIRMQTDFQRFARVCEKCFLQ